MPSKSNKPTEIDGGDPLPLSPFEQYMICDERLDSYPMSVALHWAALGEPRRDSFRKAFREAISWHPLLHSLVDHDVWRISENAVSDVQFFDNGDQPTAADRRVDARNGPTVRCNVIEQGEETSIEFMFHHAATDGVSFVEFCGDVFAIYAASIGNFDPAKIRRPTHRYLTQRANVDLAIPEPVSRSTALKFTAKESLRFVTRRAETVAADIERDTTQRDRCGGLRMMEVPFNLEESERVFAANTNGEASLNEWAILALMRVIAKWNDDHNAPSRRGWLVTNMPVLLRPRKAVRISAANMIGYGFLARQRDGIEDWDSAIQSLTEESRFIQRWKVAGMFLNGVAAVRRIPGALFFATRTTRPATCVVTNIGDPTRRFRNKLPLDERGRTIVGNFKLTRLSGSPPLRPGTHVSSSINTMGGKINLSLRVMPDFLSQNAANKLASMWKQEMIVHS
ncbi:Condensation domain protein [Planctomycetes bacterium CA13]|uniref:Condensation domain protein n=1 Tax=Novipirellula herctigrandis TaxID=2527986 RepID=A0A5C5YVX8_9BACT|nr:Condensation domain protein [Planctomycetes bacterium CA13]